MQESLRDPQMLRDVLLRRTLRAMITAAGVLQRVARGGAFGNEEQRFACLGLVRLAPAMIGWFEPEEEGSIRDLFHHSLSEEEKDYYEAEAKKPPMTREEVAESWARSFRESGSFASYTNEEEAREYGRKVYDNAKANAAANLRAIEEADRKERQRRQKQRRLRRG
jgi:hypothetical protein